MATNIINKIKYKGLKDGKIDEFNNVETTGI
jgi:hypothetical protein